MQLVGSAAARWPCAAGSEAAQKRVTCLRKHRRPPPTVTGRSFGVNPSVSARARLLSCVGGNVSWSRRSSVCQEQAPFVGRPGAVSDFDIGVGYLEGTPEDALRDFVAAIDRPNLNLRIERRKPTVRASIEWLAPTAVVVYLTKGYFDGFLSEMGKEHFFALRRAIVALGGRVLGRSGPRAAIISAGGERSTGKRFSIAYSVEAEIGERRRIKLLLPKRITKAGLTDAVEAFTTLLLDDQHLSHVVHEYCRVTPAFDPVLVWFNPEAGVIEVVHPGSPLSSRG